VGVADDSRIMPGLHLSATVFFVVRAVAGDGQQTAHGEQCFDGKGVRSKHGRQSLDLVGQFRVMPGGLQFALPQLDGQLYFFARRIARWDGQCPGSTPADSRTRSVDLRRERLLLPEPSVKTCTTGLARVIQPNSFSS